MTTRPKTFPLLRLLGNAAALALLWGGLAAAAHLIGR